MIHAAQVLCDLCKGSPGIRCFDGFLFRYGKSIVGFIRIQDLLDLIVSILLRVLREFRIDNSIQLALRRLCRFRHLAKLYRGFLRDGPGRAGSCQRAAGSQGILLRILCRISAVYHGFLYDLRQRRYVAHIVQRRLASFQSIPGSQRIVSLLRGQSIRRCGIALTMLEAALIIIEGRQCIQGAVAVLDEPTIGRRIDAQACQCNDDLCHRFRISSAPRCISAVSFLHLGQTIKSIVYRRFYFRITAII